MSTVAKSEVALCSAWISIPRSTHRKLADCILDRLLEVQSRKGYPVNK